MLTRERSGRFETKILNILLQKSDGVLFEGNIERVHQKIESGTKILIQISKLMLNI